MRYTKRFINYHSLEVEVKERETSREKEGDKGKMYILIIKFANIIPQYTHYEIHAIRKDTKNCSKQKFRYPYPVSCCKKRKKNGNYLHFRWHFFTYISHLRYLLFEQFSDSYMYICRLSVYVHFLTIHHIPKIIFIYHTHAYKRSLTYRRGSIFLFRTPLFFC